MHLHIFQHDPLLSDLQGNGNLNLHAVKFTFGYIVPQAEKMQS